MTNSEPPAVSTPKKAASALWGILILGVMVLFLAAIAGPKFAGFQKQKQKNEQRPTQEPLMRQPALKERLLAPHWSCSWQRGLRLRQQASPVQQRLPLLR